MLGVRGVQSQLRASLLRNTRSPVDTSWRPSGGNEQDGGSVFQFYVPLPLGLRLPCRFQVETSGKPHAA